MNAATAVKAEKNMRSRSVRVESDNISPGTENDLGATLSVCRWSHRFKAADFPLTT
jgi:hypothetical protein